ncbi:MAG: signal recognition particle-docking protein FtsY [Gammaproteobacteria bacterium]|nr:signal recognition particle-docking protein FtsY [Gammaproteobacteria bacterium]
MGIFSFKKNKDTSTEEEMDQEKGFWTRLKGSLSRTRHGLTDGFASLLLGKKSIDEEVLEELETRLLMADVGIEATQSIIENLTNRMQRKQLADGNALFAALREDMIQILQPCAQPLEIDETKSPFVIMMVGINGAGKTTSIGKLVKRLQIENKRVILAAADTFRAAAVEQLQTWGRRNNVDVVAQQRNADPGSVVYDALVAAKARSADVLIVDTAGRLHTQTNLMAELKKIRRVASKLDDSAPHEVLLVVDGGVGQNALNQALQFHEAVNLTGIVVTKLDGTAKGGILFAIAEKVGLPIRFIGMGEGIDDLRVFDAAQFVDALLDTEDD